MCIRDSFGSVFDHATHDRRQALLESRHADATRELADRVGPVSYTHLRAHETVLDLVCRLLLEKKNYYKKKNNKQQ